MEIPKRRQLPKQSFQRNVIEQLLLWFQDLLKSHIQQDSGKRVGAQIPRTGVCLHTHAPTPSTDIECGGSAVGKVLINACGVLYLTSWCKKMFWLLGYRKTYSKCIIDPEINPKTVDIPEENLWLRQFS